MDEGSLFLMVSLLECQGLRVQSENIKCVLTFGDHFKVSRPTQSSEGCCFFNQQFIFPFRPNSELKAVILRDNNNGNGTRTQGNRRDNTATSKPARPDDPGGDDAAGLQLSPLDYAIDVVFSDSPRVNVPVADWFDLATVGELTGAAFPDEEEAPTECGRMHVALVVFDTTFLKSVICQIGGEAGGVSLGNPSTTATTRPGGSGTSAPRAAGEGGGSSVLLKAWELLAQRQASRAGTGTAAAPTPPMSTGASGWERGQVGGDASGAGEANGFDEKRRATQAADDTM